MGTDVASRPEAITKADYDRMEREGKLSRPLTDRPIQGRSMGLNQAPNTSKGSK